MKKFILTIFSACVLASALHAGTKFEIFRSQNNLHCNDTVAVYSPSLYPGKTDLPTLFLLHGYSGSWKDWGSHTDLQDLCDRTGWRIICPDGFYASWYLDNADKSKMQWRTFFWEECWPFLQRKYGLDPKKTFITGLSMGGHGAMNLFLDHPEYFAGAGSMSGVLDLRYSSGSKQLIAEILGRANVEKCDDQSAVTRLDRLAAMGSEQARSKLLIISCGTEDNTFLPAARIFETRCKELGLKYMSYYSPGKHNWKYWPEVLPYFIAWFSDYMEE